MAAVRHIGFVVTSSYCIRILDTMFLGDITLHYIDILAMYCRVLSPSFLFLQF